MAYKQAKTYTPPAGSTSGKWYLHAINGGLNLEDDEYQLADNQSHSCKNVWYNQRFCKRWGTRNINSTSTGSLILCAYPYLYKGNMIFVSGTKLFTMTPGVNECTVLYTSLTAGARGTFFKFNGYLYYINGHQYIKYDGTNVTTITPYIPVVIINRTPTGGGSANEDYNRIGAGFINWFNGDGSSTAYTLTDTGIDATTVTCTINGVTKTEGTDFTVNRTTGVVTFTTAPSKPSSSNNVIITAYKTHADIVQTIYGCTVATWFGGSNDSRLFLGGNGTCNYYWTYVVKPEYFPMSQYNAIGTNDDPITQFGLQNDTLIIFKARSIYAATYSFNETTAVATFPVVNLNANIGCDCPGTVCLINNRLTFLNSYGGVFTLVNQFTGIVSGNIYRNVNPVSRNINGNERRPGILQESNITGAVAVDFNRKYWIAVNGKVYLWDYGTTPYSESTNQNAIQRALAWWYFSELPISCFLQDGTNLWFGESDDGYIRHFENTFFDNGAAIDAYWQMGINTLGAPNRYKKIKKWYCSCESDTEQTVTVTYFTDQNQTGIEDVQPVQVKTSFSWATFRWDTFSWGTARWFEEIARKPSIKNTKSFSIKFSNSNISEDMNISDIIVMYTATKEVR